MKRLNKGLCLVTVLTLILSVFSGTAVAATTAFSSGSTAAVSAKPLLTPVLINGQSVTFDTYQIDGSDFYKLRDIAKALSATDKSFEVMWNEEKNAIAIRSDTAYTPVGGELLAAADRDTEMAVPCASNIYFNTRIINIPVYTIACNNYFELDDIAQLLDFGAAYDEKLKIMSIDTTAVYASGGEVVASPSMPLAKTAQTLSWWIARDTEASSYTEPSDNLAYKKLKEISNIDIDWVVANYYSQAEQFNLMLAAGDYTDVIDNAEYLYAGGGESAIEDGVIMDLSDMLPKYAPDYYSFVKSNGLERYAYTESGAAPSFKQFYSSVPDADFGPVIRKDWLDKLGLESPTTYDDYYNVLKAFKTEIGADTPLSLDSLVVQKYNYLISGYGIAGISGYDEMDTQKNGFYQVDGVVKSGIAEEGYKEYLTMLNKWYNEGLFTLDFSDASEDNSLTEISKGETGLWYTGRSTLHGYDVQIKGCETVAIADAVKNAGDKNQFKEYLSQAGTESVSITTACTIPDLAAELIDYMYTDEGIELANYGLEGASFWIDDGVPVLTDVVVNNPDGLNTDRALDAYTLFDTATVVDTSMLEYAFTENEKSASAVWDSARSGGYELPEALTLLSTEDIDSFVMCYMDIQTYTEEVALKIITGAMPISEFDDYVTMLNNMGLQECIKLWQKAYDGYIAGLKNVA